jgi:endonuclease-8
MPEGHTVARWARDLGPIVGEPITSIKAPARWAEQAAEIPGQHVSTVQSRGKHLILQLSRGGAIHCHAMQYGSWQIGEPGMELRKEERYVRLRLLTPFHEAVFFHGPVMEILSAQELRAHEALAALGPDIMSVEFDRDEAWRRLRREKGRPIGDVVLDQRVLAGIGNIYKSEGLFLAQIDPRRSARGIRRMEVERAWDALQPLMAEGSTRFGATITLPTELQSNGQRHWVYRRRGHACFRCGTKIEMVRQGELERATYFCPGCQR